MRVACQILVVLLSASRVTGSFTVDISGEVEFNAAGTSDLAATMLTETMGVVCYSDWLNPEDGQCNALDFSSGAPVKGDPVVLNASTKSQKFTVSRFSDVTAVVCYTPFGVQGAPPICNVLALSGSGSDAALSVGTDFQFNTNAPSSAVHSYTMSVAGLTEATGLLCYQDTTNVYEAVTRPGNRRDCGCHVLVVEGTSLKIPSSNSTVLLVNDDALDNVEKISLARISNSMGVVCYADSTEERVDCNLLSVSGTLELSNGPAFTLSEALPGSLSVASLSESQGVACYCGISGSMEGPTCTPLSFANGGEVSKAGEDLTVGTASCSDVSLTAMSETAAITCYLSGSDGIGMCSGLVLSHGTNLSMGDPSEIQSGDAFKNPPTCETNPCEQWISVSRRDDDNAVACYAGVAGSETGRCSDLLIPPPTSTTTATSISETSSSTEHTTTGTSSITATETSTVTTSGTATHTTVSVTSKTSSTTPHTTTETSTATLSTETSTTIPSESSGAGLTQVGVCVMALLVFGVLH